MSKLRTILKNILLNAKDIAIETATSSIPGAATVISGVTRLVDHDDTNNSGAVAEIGEGVITAVTSLKGEQVVDAGLLAQGIAELKSGFEKVRRAIK